MSFSAFLARVTRPIQYEHRRLLRKLKRAGLEERTVQVENGSVHMWVGDGPEEQPLVLLQGFGGTATWQWHEQARVLGKKHRLFLPDMLYFGASTSSREDYSVEHQAETLGQVMDELGVPCFDLGGLSYGGLVALQFTLDHPDRVRKLIVTSSSGAVMTQEDLDQTVKRLEADDIEQIFIPEDPLSVRRLVRIAWRRPPWTPHFAMLDAHQQLFSQQVEAKRQLLRHLLERVGDDEALAGEIPHPTLLLWGEHDPVFPVAIGQRLAEHLGDSASLRVIEGTAHCPNLERPKQWNGAVLDFLAAPTPG